MTPERDLQERVMGPRLVRHDHRVDVVGPEGAVLFGYNVGGGMRPHIHPLHLPGSAAVLTRWRPWDHPWHYGIFTGMNDVDGLDFWCNDVERLEASVRGRIEHDELRDLKEEERGAGFECLGRWKRPQGELLAIESQRIWVPAQELGREPGRAYHFDFSWTLHAREDIRFGASPYGGLTVRLDGCPQTVRFLTAEGSPEVPARAPQIASRWVAIANCIDGVSTYQRPTPPDYAYAGVAVLDHPGNPRHPVHWCGDATCAFLCPSVVVTEPLFLRSGESLSLRYRLVAFAGLPDQQVLERLWQDFAG